MSSKKGILKTDVPKFVVEDTTVPHVSASPDNHESNKLITGTNRTPPTEMDNAANLSVKSTRNLQRKQKTGTGSYDSGQTVSESLGTSHAAKTTTKGITWDDLESTTDYKEELLNRSDDSQSKNSRETNKQTSYTVSNNSSRTLKSGAESSAPYLEQPPTLSATDSRQTGRKQLSVSGVTQSASKDGNSSRHPETAVRMGGVGKNRQSGIGGKNSGSVEQTASGIQTKSVGERSSKEVFTESQWRPHMDTGVVSQRSTVRTSVVKDSQVSPEVSSVRDDAPSREDNLSLVDESEDAGRKFTSKKTAHKSNFGSSTTLSSATEVSDDNDTDVFQVVLRVRPLSVQEKQRRDNFAVTFPGDGKCAVDNSGSQRSFQFNTVFEPDATQEDVFENSGIKRLVDNAVAGYNCTAFAFGQTGSGKTHTMTGPPAQNRDGYGNKIPFHQVGVTPDPNMYGIIQRSFKYMYQLIKQQGGGKVIRASYLEVYNEQVIDLLNNSHRRYLSVRWSKNRGFYVENLFTIECEALDDVMAVLEEGLRNRQTGSHGLNEFSSRSHSVLTVTIDSETQPDSEDDNLYVTKRGKLSFVDLAGSEKVKDASGGNAVGPGILESNSINKSLLVLGNCISHLADAKRRQGHIPYRDSKLTKLLSDSLGGNGITLMIACITPSSANITETMNTLRYASRAKKIKTKPTVKMDPREKLILSLKREIKVLRNENHYLRQQLDFPAKPKGQLQKENDEKFMKFMKEQQQKESGLYEMLQEYMVENENLRAENSEMHSTRDRIRREQQLLYRENEKLMKRMEEMERTISQNPAFWSAVHHPNRTDGYGQMDVIVPTNQPLLGYQSGHSQKGYTPPVGPASPPGSRGRPILPGPIKPPHRLPEPVMRPAQRPAEVVHNGEAMYPNNGFVSPRLAPRQVSPTRNIERNPSQLSTTDAIHSMNEQLKREVMQLEGEIRHHQHARGDRGSQDVKRSSVNNSLTAR